jgi:hypothetical protein
MTLDVGYERILIQRKRMKANRSVERKIPEIPACNLLTSKRYPPAFAGSIH